jgi:hypothetical protein
MVGAPKDLFEPLSPTRISCQQSQSRMPLVPARSRVDASSKGRPKNLQTPKKGSQPLSSLDGICQAQSGDTASSKRAMTKVTDLARGRLRLRGDRRSEGRNTWWTLEASAERGADWGANHGSAMRRARAGCTDAGCKPKTQDQKSVRSIVMPAAGVRACVRACGACRTGVEIKTLRGEVFRGEKKRIGKKKTGTRLDKRVGPSQHQEWARSGCLGWHPRRNRGRQKVDVQVHASGRGAQCA